MSLDKEKKRMLEGEWRVRGVKDDDERKRGRKKRSRMGRGREMMTMMEGVEEEEGHSIVRDLEGRDDGGGI